MFGATVVSVNVVMSGPTMKFVTPWLNPALVALWIKKPASLLGGLELSFHAKSTLLLVTVIALRFDGAMGGVPVPTNAVLDDAESTCIVGKPTAGAAYT